MHQLVKTVQHELSHPNKLQGSVQQSTFSETYICYYLHLKEIFSFKPLFLCLYHMTPHTP